MVELCVWVPHLLLRHGEETCLVTLATLTHLCFGSVVHASGFTSTLEYSPVTSSLQPQ